LTTGHRGIAKNLTYEQVFNHALEMFQFNKDKTLSWWMSPQQELGDKSPFQFVKEGNGRALVRIIERCKL